MARFKVEVECRGNMLGAQIYHFWFKRREGADLFFAAVEKARDDYAEHKNDRSNTVVLDTDDGKTSFRSDHLGTVRLIEMPIWRALTREQNDANDKLEAERTANLRRLMVAEGLRAPLVDKILAKA